jgi:signal transduction histidine kinase
MVEIKTQRLQGYRRLIDIARDLASTLDLDTLLNHIIQAAAEITAAEAASILLYDSTARQLHFQVATNIAPPLMRGLVVPLEGSIAGWIVTNRLPVRTSNVQEDMRHYGDIEQFTHFSVHSLLGVPMITKDKVIGALEVLNKKQGGFTNDDENYLSVLGSQAAVAIENARLFQQSDLISEFVHELRTPLASLSTATYLLLQPEFSPQQCEQTTKNIYNETVRLSKMVSTFLDLARLESGRVQFHFQKFNVGELLQECLEALLPEADEEQVQIKVEVHPDLPLLEADRDRIKQVVINLLNNAIKYNHPNGSVTMKAEGNEERITLSVEDTGVGIPDTAIPRLFEKFYRVRESESKVSGTGLGLSICRQIVQGHRGTIEVKSQPGVGTVFIVRLPCGIKNQILPIKDTYSSRSRS